MAYEPRELSGSIFPNDRKTAPNMPDYKGSCLIDGVEYWVSGWLKQSIRGKFLSMAYQPKEARPAAVDTSGGLDDVPVKAPTRTPKPNFEDFDDSDIPF